MLLRYFQKLVAKTWHFAISTIEFISLLAYIFLVDTPKPLPLILFIIFLIFGFIASNYTIFREMQERLDRYEAIKANIQVKPTEFNELYSPIPSKSHIRPLIEGLDDNGFYDTGVPKWITLVIAVEFRNHSQERGHLIQEIDSDETKLPKLFRLYNIPDNIYVSKGFFEKDTLNIPPYRQAKVNPYSRFWYLHIEVAELDLRKFATQLASLEKLTFVIQYCTEYLSGEFSDWEHFRIDMDTKQFKNELENYWRGYGHKEILDFYLSVKGHKN